MGAVLDWIGFETQQGLLAQEVKCCCGCGWTCCCWNRKRLEPGSHRSDLPMDSPTLCLRVASLGAGKAIHSQAVLVWRIGKNDKIPLANEETKQKQVMPGIVSDLHAVEHSRLSTVLWQLNISPMKIVYNNDQLSPSVCWVSICILILAILTSVR